MKFILLILAVLLVSCSQNKFLVPTAPSDPKLEAEKIFQTLQSKPDWLFPADACPSDVIPDFETKIKYLSEGCADNPESCLEKCKNNDGNACYSLALLLQKYQDKSVESSEALFLRSCKLGIVSGCTNRAAGTYNLDSGDSEQTKCAVDTFEKTCSRDDAWGCEMYGLVLVSGNGREKNITEALKYLSKTCSITDENDEACQQARQLEKQIKTNLESENK